MITTITRKTKVSTPIRLVLRSMPASMIPSKLILRNHTYIIQVIHLLVNPQTIDMFFEKPCVKD
jgi:hypothetical protein